MQLYFSNSRNFGDALNAWMWPKLIPEVLASDSNDLFVAIGTLLNDKVPAEPKKAVFGSGVGYGDRPAVIDDRWKIYCVRGPLSANTLGLNPDMAVTDPAALVSVLPHSELAPTGRVAFIPHWRSANYWDWDGLCKSVNIDYINPEWEVSKVLDRIRQSRLVVTEAMHGAILADCYRVPWIPVRMYEHILDYKWLDWCASMNLEYQPETLPPIYFGNRRIAIRLLRARQYIKSASSRAESIYDSSWGTLRSGWRRVVREDDIAIAHQLRTISETVNPTLSSESILDDRISELQHRLDMLRADYAR